VGKGYQIVMRAGRDSAGVIEQFCQSKGQLPLPLANLSASKVVETVTHEIGVKTPETILVLSAEQVTGARQPGKAHGEVRHYGSQPGRILLADRKVKLKRPRLRHKTKGEVPVMAWELLRQDRGLSQYVLGALAANGTARRKCLASTKVIESPQSGVRRRTWNVSRWRDAAMAERWAASAWLLIEKHSRRLYGYRELWSLAAILGREIDPAKKGKAT
jgi:hypothetical protein